MKETVFHAARVGEGASLVSQLPLTPGEIDALAQSLPGYANAELDALRAQEFGRLDAHGDIYLDYTGAGLHAASHVLEHAALLNDRALGNPHSLNPTSHAATELCEAARDAVFRHFNADPDRYDVVFTANASAALKLVAESYPFAEGGRFVLSYDNHNSVNGIREYARSRGASVDYAPVLPPAMRLDEAALRALLDAPAGAAARLFAFPAQSNFSGVLHPLQWIERAQERGWDVLLDAAAFAPTHRLDLSEVAPDFVSLSFYKMFGYPTGVGALIVKRSAFAKLRRPWFAGGTIAYASVVAPRHDLHEGHEGYEDGTLNFLNLPAIAQGLERLRPERLAAIEARTTAIAGWTLRELAALRHSNGAPMVSLYGPLGVEGRGASIAFNLLDPDGALIDHQRVDERATAMKISLRTGCFCNPGAGEAALGISAEELSSCFRSHDRMNLQHFRACISDKGSGAVRVSFGVASTLHDAHALLGCLIGFRDERAAGVV